MKKIFLLITLTIAVCSFSLNENNTNANCNLSISKVNDSTYVISNYNIGYELDTKIMMGSPNIYVSNDTIYSTGVNFSIACFARDSSNCMVSQLITKF